MPSSDNDKKLLQYLGEAKSKYRELSGVLEFYEKLFHLQLVLKAELDHYLQETPRWRHTVDHVRLVQGTPQITFEELHVEQKSLANLFKLISELLVKYVSPQQLSDADLHPDAILGMARQFFESRNPVVVSDPAGSLQTIAAGFALMPYLQTACELLMPFIDQSVWQRSYCPVCGGKPVFASLARESGTRCLLCSRCTGIWQYGRVGCPFCEAAEDLIYYPSDDGRYRLYVCDTCKRYLKTIDLRESEQEVYLPVECIVTVAMDIAAQDKGYRHY